MRKMKDSGIVRLGLMPKEWSASRVKYIYSVIGSGTTPSSGNTLYYDGTENWIQSGDLYKRKYVTNTEKTISDFAVSTISALHKYKADFIVIAMYGASIGNVAISKIDACVNQACCVIKPNSKVNFNYLYYTLVNDKDIMLDMSIGGTQPNISQTKILELPVFLPSLAEQKKIADFLDEKCGEIDSIRSDVQREIEILNDYKKSVITEAVTKGLNSKAKLKDSGIEWIGKIPEGWDSIKAKYLFKQRNSRGNTIDLQLLSPSQKFGVIPQSKLEELTTQKVVKLNEKVNLAELKTIHKGDFCISLRSFQGGFEYSEYEGVVSPAYQVFYSIVPSCNGYYRYLFKEKSFIEKMNSFTMSLRDGKNIAFEDFANSEMPVPPLSEQKAIADYLDEKCSEINATIADKQKQIETLDEYKKSLIFEYVTGKKEVV